MTLRTKFHLASACLILTVVVGMMASLFVYEKKRLWTEIDREQHADIDKLARVFEDALNGADETALLNYARNLPVSAAPKVAYVGVVYNVEKMGAPWMYTPLVSPSFSYLSPDDVGVRAVRVPGVMHRDVRFMGKHVNEVSRSVGRLGWVRVGYDEDVINAMFRRNVNRVIWRFSMIGAIAIGFGLIASGLFSRALSKPIIRLMNGAEAIASGKKGVRIAENRSDELGRLTHTFNHMSEELTKLDQLKDDFMSHVTHELRSPLTSIIATVELMAEMPIYADAKVKRSIDRLMYGSERLNRLVDNILDLTRMEAGKMAFDIQPVDICTLLKEMADFFEPRAQEKGLSIKATVPASFPLVMCDPERIRQVISNLVYNAVKFTNQGGITLWVRTNGKMAEVGVQDTGVGIPADKLASVFEKFETLKHTRDKVEKPVAGSGLGLNIVKNSVHAQGGNVWVESTIDVASTFLFSLPIATAEQARAAAAKAVPASAQRTA